MSDLTTLMRYSHASYICTGAIGLGARATLMSYSTNKKSLNSMEYCCHVDNEAVFFLAVNSSLLDSILLLLIFFRCYGELGTSNLFSTGHE